jgi:hypothetical protein
MDSRNFRKRRRGFSSVPKNFGLRFLLFCSGEIRRQTSSRILRRSVRSRESWPDIESWQRQMRMGMMI